jgi:hypothetical protein
MDGRFIDGKRIRFVGGPGSGRELIVTEDTEYIKVPIPTNFTERVTRPVGGHTPEHTYSFSGEVTYDYIELWT